MSSGFVNKRCIELDSGFWIKKMIIISTKRMVWNIWKAKSKKLLRLTMDCMDGMYSSDTLFVFYWHLILIYIFQLENRTNIRAQALKIHEIQYKNMEKKNKNCEVFCTTTADLRTETVSRRKIKYNWIYGKQDIVWDYAYNSVHVMINSFLPPLHLFFNYCGEKSGKLSVGSKTGEINEKTINNETIETLFVKQKVLALHYSL